MATLEDAGYRIVGHFYTEHAFDFAQSPVYAIGQWPLKLLSMVNKDLAVRILGGHSLMVLVT